MTRRRIDYQYPAPSPYAVVSLHLEPGLWRVIVPGRPWRETPARRAYPRRAYAWTAARRMAEQHRP